MRLGIVSDTHDDADVVAAAVRVFEDAAVDTVVHCGDFVAPFSATPFDAGFEFYAVRGNNDGEWALQEVVGEFGTYLGEMGELSFDGASVAVYHGTSPPVVDALLECGAYDYVLYGHTHEYAHERRGDTVGLNPGGVPIPGADDPPAAVVLDTGSGDVERHPLP